MKNNTTQTVRNVLTFLLLMSMTLPVMANSFSDKATRSGTSGGVSWNAIFQIEFENNTDHSYGWWTGDGEGSMWNRLCTVEVGNGATCTTANPGFDVKLGVGVKHSKDMEYQNTDFDWYLVKDNGETKKIAGSYLNSDDSQCYLLDNYATSYGYITHPQLFRTGSGKTSYGHQISAHVTLTKKAWDEGYTRLEVKGYSKYYKNPTLRAKVWMYVHYDYYIKLGQPKFELAPEPEYKFTSPTELTVTFSNNSLSRINSSQMINTSESARLGLRNCGIVSSKVNTNCYLYVQAKINGYWKDLDTLDINTGGYEPNEVKLTIPADKPIRLYYFRSTTSTHTMKTAYYRGGKWTEGNADIKQVSDRVRVIKEFSNAPLSAIKADFNQVTGKVLISWDKNTSYLASTKFHVYRTLLYDDGTYAGNREELGSTTSNTFEDNMDRGIAWGRKYRYEVVLLDDEWLKAGVKIPTDPQPLTGVNFSQCTVNTTPALNFHLTQDMDETEKIKINWTFQNIPEKESDLNFRIHRIEGDGTLTQDYGNVSARRKDGKATFTDDKPESNCETYRYYVQLDLFDNSLHYFSDTLTARITAATTLTDMTVTKGSSNDACGKGVAEIMQRVVEEVELHIVAVNLAVAFWLFVGERGFAVLAACAHIAVILRQGAVALYAVDAEVEVALLLGDVLEGPVDLDCLSLIHVLGEVEVEGGGAAHRALREIDTGEGLWVGGNLNPGFEPLIVEEDHLIAVLAPPCHAAIYVVLKRVGGGAAQFLTVAGISAVIVEQGAIDIEFGVGKV